jgi:hypothetical protein
MTEIRELNRRILINQYLYGQDQAGGNTRLLLSTYPAWAKITKTSGSRVLDNMQIIYTEAYEIIKRYERTRALNLNDEILYEGSVLSIAAVEEIEEGSKQWQKITAYSTGKTVSGEVDILCSWYSIQW